MSFESYRELFPVTMQKIYLNHAAISPLSTRVTDKIDEFVDERSFGSIDVYRSSLKIREEARVSIAQMINGQPDQIAFIGNTSEGFNHLVQGLEWKPGDEIILTDYEFPSNIYPFLNLESRGVKIRYVPNRDGRIAIEDIRAMISGKTRLLSISFVEFGNGFRNNLEAIGKICAEHGVLFSVDSIQGLGAIPLDVQKCQIDFLSNGGHKWLMGLMGAGFMYIAPKLFDKIKPAYTGWLAVENAWDFFDYDLKLLPDARRFEYATANFLGITALSASVALLLEVKPERIEQHLLQLGRLLVDGLRAAGMTFAGSNEKAEWSGIYSFGGKDTEKLHEHLTGNEIVCSLRNGLIRIAPHFYNTADEIKEVIETVEKFYR